MFLFAGAGSNVINGGGNSTLNFSQAPAGVTVNLQSHTASGGFGGSQSVSGIQTVIGSNWADALIASAPGQTLIGLSANCPTTQPCNDFFQAGPTGGDTLEVTTPQFGGQSEEHDTFCAMSSCQLGGTSTGGGNTMIGGSGDDFFYTQNGAPDKITGGGGFNYALIDPNDTVTDPTTFNTIQT